MKAASEAQPDKPTRAIILEGEVNLPEEVAAIMPSYPALAQTINHNRVNPFKDFEIGDTLQTLNIPEEFTKTLDGKQFLRYDSGKEDPNRFLVFTTDDNLSLLNENRHWLFDGTFKMVKDVEGIYQLVTLHILKRGIFLFSKLNVT